MEILNTLLKDVKIRLRNPLLSSFLIAWLLINWKVTVGFVFYSNELLIKEGFGSKINLVRSNYSGWNYYIFPLVSSLLYVFVFPFIKMGTAYFETWIKRQQDTVVLQIAKQGVVSGELHYTKIAEVQQAKAEIIKLSHQETIFKKEVEDKDKEIQQLLANKAILEERAHFIDKYSNVSTLNGRWIIHYYDDNKVQHEKRVSISAGYVTDNSAHLQPTELFKITDMAYNPQTQALHLFFERSGFNARHAVLLRLGRTNDFTFLRNHENEGVIIQLERLSF